MAGAGQSLLYPNLVDPEFHGSADFHSVWRRLRAENPIHWHASTEYPGFWVLTRYADARAVLLDHETFSSAQGILLRPQGQGADPGGGRTLALTDAPRHGALRRVVDSWFNKRSVRGLEEMMRSVVGGIVDRALQQETCDFVADIAAPLPVYVICALMGVPQADHERVFQLAKEAFGADTALARSAAHHQLLRYFLSLSGKRARAPQDDLVSALATATVDGRQMSPEDVVLNCDNLLVGGTENVRLTAAGGMFTFLRHPDQWAAVRRDPSFLASAVEEILRWTSTPTHLMRTAIRPTILRGFSIAAGDRVTLWVPSANRDETVFPEPDRFDISRRPNRHLSLGLGEHFCLGSVLARTELRILFEELVSRVERVEQAGPEVRLRSIVVGGLERLPVRLTPAAVAR
ncbi:cytochrome P450 [Micromonospora sp. NPDC050980]|uniref:cytochrome P450 n=1 Tax=Micromonospora sp. NPDC050980 TaxID=3155161 RepID=UPI0033C2E83B